MTTRQPGEVDHGAAGSPGHELAEPPKIDDQWYQAFPNEPVPVGIDPKDGLPRPAISASIESAQSPWPEVDTFICMADTSKYVLRDELWGRIVAEFAPDEVTTTPGGATVVPTSLAIERVDPGAKERAVAVLAATFVPTGTRQPGPPSPGYVLHQLVYGSGYLGVRPGGRTQLITDEYAEVEPIRPQCQHYARQAKEFPEERERTELIRLCTARRTDEGEFVSLNDGLMYCCDLRRPAFGNGAERASVMEAEIIERGRLSKKRREEFDLDGALKAEGAPPAKSGGIFGP